MIGRGQQISGRRPAGTRPRTTRSSSTVRSPSSTWGAAVWPIRAGCACPGQDIEALRAAGCDGGEILEANQVIAYVAYANSTALSLGVTTKGDILGLPPHPTTPASGRTGRAGSPPRRAIRGCAWADRRSPWPSRRIKNGECSPEPSGLPGV